MLAKTNQRYIKEFTRLLITITAMGLLTACSRTKEMVGQVWQDRGEAYTKAQDYPALQMPKGIAKDTTTDTYCIPENSPQTH